VQAGVLLDNDQMWEVVVYNHQLAEELVLGHGHRWVGLELGQYPQRLELAGEKLDNSDTTSKKRILDRRQRLYQDQS
jgi:hypothetical protein